MRSRQIERSVKVVIETSQYQNPVIHKNYYNSSSKTGKKTLRAAQCGENQSRKNNKNKKQKALKI